MSSEFVPPQWYIAWGLFFHGLGAVIFYRGLNKIPLVGESWVAELFRLLFSLATYLTVINHVYHLIGIPLEVQEIIFLACVTLVVPAQFCLCRCFFLELPRGLAILCTILNIFAGAVWPNITKAAFDLPTPPFVIGLPEFFEEHETAPTQHFATEVMILFVNVFTYMQLSFARTDKEKEKKAA